MGDVEEVVVVVDRRDLVAALVEERAPDRLRVGLERARSGSRAGRSRGPRSCGRARRHERPPPSARSAGTSRPGPADSSTSPIRAVAVTVPSTLPVSHGGVIARLSGTPNGAARVLEAQDQRVRRGVLRPGRSARRRPGVPPSGCAFADRLRGAVDHARRVVVDLAEVLRVLGRSRPGPRTRGRPAACARACRPRSRPCRRSAAPAAGWPPAPSRPTPSCWTSPSTVACAEKFSSVTSGLLAVARLQHAHVGVDDLVRPRRSRTGSRAGRGPAPSRSRACAGAIDVVRLDDRVDGAVGDVAQVLVGHAAPDAERDRARSGCGRSGSRRSRPAARRPCAARPPCACRAARTGPFLIATNQPCASMSAIANGVRPSETANARTLEPVAEHAGGGTALEHRAAAADPVAAEVDGLAREGAVGIGVDRAGGRPGEIRLLRELRLGGRDLTRKDQDQCSEYRCERPTTPQHEVLPFADAIPERLFITRRGCSINRGGAEEERQKRLLILLPPPG